MKKSIKILVALLLSGLVLGFAGCKTDSDDDSTDKTAPADVTDLVVTCVNGTGGKVNAVLSWTDPADKDLFGMEVTYTENTTSRAAVSAMTKGSIFVAPGNKGVVITGLTAGTTYAFTVKAMDTNGNKSSGAEKVAKMSLSQLTELKITLTPSTTEPTNQDVTVSVEAESLSSVSKIFYVSGIKTSIDEVLKGTDITLSAKFDVTDNETCTVAVLDYDGRRELSYIKIENIDKKDPVEVTDLAANYDSDNKKIIVTWGTSDTDIDYYLVSYKKDSTEVVTNEKVTEKTYTVNEVEVSETEEIYTFTVKAVDKAGNKGSESSKEINPSKSPIVTDFVIPTAGTKKQGEAVTATVTGKNFKADGVTSANFSLTCAEPSITADSIITIKSDSELTVTLTIPKAAGSYDVTITSGSSKTATFTVKESSSYEVGDIILADGTKIDVANIGSCSITADNAPVAVACFNENGVAFGLGLKISGTSLQWAKDSTTGYNTNFTKIIGTKDSGDMDGSDNWEYICSIDSKASENAATNYPAFNFAANYGTGTCSFDSTSDLSKGWYIPSISELYIIFKRKEILQNSLNKAGGFEIGEKYYWSSSQTTDSSCAWGLYSENGNCFDDSKKNYNHVLVLRTL